MKVLMQDAVKNTVVGRFDCILSDMSPFTDWDDSPMGDRMYPYYETWFRHVMDSHSSSLKFFGVIKLLDFLSPNTISFVVFCVMMVFKRVRLIKPGSARPTSTEIYMVVEGIRNVSFKMPKSASGWWLKRVLYERFCSSHLDVLMKLADHYQAAYANLLN